MPRCNPTFHLGITLPTHLLGSWDRKEAMGGMGGLPAWSVLPGYRTIIRHLPTLVYAGCPPIAGFHTPGFLFLHYLTYLTTPCSGSCGLPACITALWRRLPRKHSRAGKRCAPLRACRPIFIPLFTLPALWVCCAFCNVLRVHYRPPTLISPTRYAFGSS